MTRYIADYASYQDGLTVADLHRAEFQVVNFKTSHALTTKAVHPGIVAQIASARRLGMGIGTFHWLTGNTSGTAQADYAFGRLKALGLTEGTMHTVDVEEQNADGDTESAPGYAHVRDYVLRMEALLGRPIALYTGDWWWQGAGRGWDGHKLTPYLMAAPNAGYTKDKAYPGDTDAAAWRAGYGGWPTLTIMQYAVDTLACPGGGRSAVKVSKAAMRDDAPWRVLTGGGAVATRTSQNGWPVVLDRSKITDPVLFGEDFPNGWLKGDVDVVFRYLIERLHREVEPIDFAHKADDWGYYVKDIEGSDEESNHSSGTAFDYNAHTHPMGVRNTYSKADQDKIRAILRYLEGVVRWGADYTGRPDDMHFEIDDDAAAVKRVADKIRAAQKPQEQEDFPMEQAQFNKLMSGWAKSAEGKQALAQAVLTYDPGKGVAGGIENVDPDPAKRESNPTVSVAWAAGNRPQVAVNLGYQIRDRVDAVARTLDTLDAVLAEIRAAVTAPPTGPDADEISRNG